MEVEFAIIFTCYKLRRSLSILGVKELTKRLKAMFCSIFTFLIGILRRSKPTFYIIKNNPTTISNFYPSLESRYADFGVYSGN